MSPSLPSWRTPSLAMLPLRLPAHLWNALNTSLGLLLVTLAAEAIGGYGWALGVSIGVVIASMPDLPSQPERKARELLPAVVLAAALYGLALWLHDSALWMPVLLAIGSFLAVLPQAWGKRGGPLSSSMMFGLVLPLAVAGPQSAAMVVEKTALFAAGGLGYLAWTRCTATLLDSRYRALALATCIDTLAGLLRLHAADLRTPRDRNDDAPGATHGDAFGGTLSALVAQQATWADQLQAARDLAFNRLRTARQRHVAAALLALIEVRDLLLACQLDLGMLRRSDSGERAVQRHAGRFDDTAAVLERTALRLRRGGIDAAPQPPRWRSLRALRRSRGQAEALSSALTDRQAAGDPGTDAPLAASQIDGVVRRRLDALTAQASQLEAIVAAPPAEAVVPLGEDELQLFVSPDRWRWAYLRERLRWRSSIVRYAIRTVLAMLTAYAVAVALPWSGHKHWVLVTVAVVLRSSYAQTADRRRWRLAGTAVGCVLAAVLLKVSSDTALLFVAVVIAAGVSHGYATVRYAVTAAAASVLGLVQTHLLAPGGNLVVVERLADTLLGIGIAWAFSFVLPVWERQQMPDLIRRLLGSHARNAALTLRRFDARAVPGAPAADDATRTGGNPAIDWRLARREVNDAQAALIAGLQRMRAEPRLVQLPMPTVVALLAHSQELTAHLVAIAALLVLRREQLDPGRVATPLRDTGETLQALLDAAADPAAHTEPAVPPPRLQGALPMLPPDDAADRTPWLLRRLEMAESEARRLVAAAQPLLRMTVR